MSEQAILLEGDKRDFNITKEVCGKIIDFIRASDIEGMTGVILGSGDYGTLSQFCLYAGGDKKLGRKGALESSHIPVPDELAEAIRQPMEEIDTMTDRSFIATAEQFLVRIKKMHPGEEIRTLLGLYNYLAADLEPARAMAEITKIAQAMAKDLLENDLIKKEKLQNHYEKLRQSLEALGQSLNL